MFNMLFTIIFPVLCGLSMPLLKKISNRKIKMALIVSLQAITTVFGILTVTKENVTTKPFVFADNLSLRFVCKIFLCNHYSCMVACNNLRHNLYETRKKRRAIFPFLVFN